MFVLESNRENEKQNESKDKNQYLYQIEEKIVLYLFFVCLFVHRYGFT